MTAAALIVRNGDTRPGILVNHVYGSHDALCAVISSGRLGSGFRPVRFVRALSVASRDPSYAGFRLLVSVKACTGKDKKVGLWCQVAPGWSGFIQGESVEFIHQGKMTIECKKGNAVLLRVLQDNKIRDTHIVNSVFQVGSLHGNDMIPADYKRDPMYDKEKFPEIRFILVRD